VCVCVCVCVCVIECDQVIKCRWNEVNNEREREQTRKREIIHSVGGPLLKQKGPVEQLGTPQPAVPGGGGGLR
jgi:hypothetical protein